MPNRPLVSVQRTFWWILLSQGVVTLEAARQILVGIDHAPVYAVDRERQGAPSICT